MKNNYEVLIIGGGLFGCMIALHLKKHFNNVVILEKSEDLLTRASYNNQARVHNGYHYPRSYLTALRSHINYPLFLKDFTKAIEDKITMKYAIGQNLSKTNSRQFVKFCEQVGCPIKKSSPNILNLFNKNLIENVFDVDEAIFDAGKLRKLLKERLHKNKIPVIYNSAVVFVKKHKNGVLITLKNGNEIVAKNVFNCTYSQINKILQASNLAPLPFKYELTEMILYKAPEELKNIGVTIMDGPFWGTLPFPDQAMHTLYHVRYTVHATWFDNETQNSWPDLEKLIQNSNALYMIKDAERYMPILKNIKSEKSLFEIRTVLRKNELNDGRPILFRKDYGIKGFHVVMGGKIDNIYDILKRIDND